MKLAVLSRGPSLYSTRRLVSVARRRGHNVDVLDPVDLSIAMVDGEPRLFEGSYELECPDAVIPRIGASVTYYGLAVLRHLELMGAVPLNAAEPVANARDKFRCLQVLLSKGVPMPATALSRRPAESGAIDELGEGPLVVKLLQGTQGKGVVLAESRAAATSIMDAFQQVDKHILVQEFVGASAGRDVRAFVVGREVVAVMERRARAGEFRSNLHCGGRARAITLTRALERIALRATRALGLDIAGVDLLLGEDGPLVIEVNACPGLEGIERVSGVNVAGRVIDHLEASVEPARRRSRAAV